MQIRHALTRAKLILKFAKMLGESEQIEKEWQRIQQAEHDFLYAFQTSLNDEDKSNFLYKKGVADGIKWCIKNFC